MNKRIKTRHESRSEKVCPAGSGQNNTDTLSPALKVRTLVRKSFRGSLTLEAAASLPLFMMICAAMISFLVICALQINIQIRMEETARIMGKAAFLLEHSVSSEGSSGNTAGAIGSGELSVMNAGLNSASIKLMLMGGGLSGKVDRSRIVGGASGLYTHNSSYNDRTGILDIVAEYDYSVPWVPQSWGRIRLAQRMRTHAWIGKKLSSMAGGISDDGRETERDADTVYVTPTGSVYHLSPSCHYLDLSIHAQSYSLIPDARNANGEKYSACPLCAGAGHSGTVYITDYGSDYHTSLECSGLKRTVIEKDISEVEGMRVCTKCREGQHEHD